MCEFLIGGITAIASSVVTVLLSFFVEKWKSKQERKRAVLQTEIDIYAKAIRYIVVIALLERNSGESTDSSNDSELKKEENELYNSFHPVFSIIAPQEKIDAYNELRNQIVTEHISPENAYKKAIEILDYNIWEKS